MEDKNILLLVGLICLTILEIVALVLGHNGVLFAGVVALIAGIAGYTGKAILVNQSKAQ